MISVLFTMTVFGYSIRLLQNSEYSSIRVINWQHYLLVLYIILTSSTYTNLPTK
jgi:hypothetical protein